MDGQPKQSWWNRNWKWAVPGGCLGCLGVMALVIGVIFAGVWASFKSSVPYRDAVARAEASPEVAAALGEPLSVGWQMMGSINVDGPSGDVDMSIPISGPDGEGRLYVVGVRQAGEWSYDVLEVEVEGRAERIDLLANGL